MAEQLGSTIRRVSGGQVSYARLGDDEVAYSVSGSGSDLLHIPGLLNHIESAAEEPTVARHYAQLASFSRLVFYDRRGAGLSSPLRGNHPLTLEERADEALAVLDAVGIERGAVYSTADGVPVALMLAATHPERVSALALYGGTARMLTEGDYPEGWDPDIMAQAEDAVFALWGDDADPTQSGMIVPSHYGDPAVIRSIGRMQRLAGTPLAARRFWDLFLAMDVRELLKSVEVPTLVLHCSGDLLFPVAQGRYVASHIRDAKFVELTGTDHFYFWELGDEVASEIELFVTGVRGVRHLNRKVMTVLFTDIVGSTQRATSLGDRRWGELLDAHHQAVRTQLLRFGGNEINTAGDGFFATFDGPARAIRCACTIRDAVGGLGLQIRAGIHTGEVELAETDLRGIAVHIGARVGAAARPDEVLVSRTVTDLVVGSGIKFEDRGEHELKGVEAPWRLYSVVG